MYETFNNWILAARFKSMITKLQEIRVKVMKRMTQNEGVFCKMDN